MKVVLDSYELLRAIGAHPKVFACIGEAVRKQASALLVAQLKQKTLSLPRLREIRDAIDAEAFELFMDTADDKLLKGIAKKIDPHCSQLKSDHVDDLRRHLIGLAEGKCEPSPKPTKSVRAAKKAPAQKRSERSGGTLAGHAITSKPPGRR